MGIGLCHYIRRLFRRAPDRSPRHAEHPDLKLQVVLRLLIRRLQDPYRVSKSKTQRQLALAALAAKNEPVFCSIWDQPTYGKMNAWYRLRRLCHSRHTTALEALAVGMVIVVIVVACTVWQLNDESTPPVSRPAAASQQAAPAPPDRFPLALFIGPAVWITLFQLVYTTGAKRRATAAMITGEVISVIRVYAAANIIGAFIRKWQEAGCNAATLSDGFADVARKENYMAVFEKNIEHLGSFSNRLLFDLTAFYTFLKAARDATGALAHWGIPGYTGEKKQKDVVDIVYLCFLQLDHGYLALEHLIERRDKRALHLIQDVTFGPSLQSYLFLLNVMDDADFRYPALISRLRRYAARAESHQYTDLWRRGCPKHIRRMAAQVRTGHGMRQ